jgi:acyl dehydratase
VAATFCFVENMKQMKRYPGCFVCGDKNPIGLNVAFFSDEINVKFKKMVKIGEKLFLEGRLVQDRGRILVAQGKVTNQENEVVATGEAKFLRAEGELKDRLAGNLE